MRGAKPAFAFAAENLDLGLALDRLGHRFAALLAVPFRTPGGLQGLGVFYYGPDTARPGPEVLEHLAEIPRALSFALELAATLNTVKAAERALELALAGTASLGGLEHLVGSIETLRDQLGEIRNRTDAPSWFTEQYVRLAPALASALDDGRSLLAFSRGEIRREAVYLEDLLAELRTPEVTVELEPAAETVQADAALLRVALRAIVDEVRSRSGANTAPLSIRVGAWSDGVRVGVSSPGAPPRTRRGGRSPPAWASTSPGASPSCTAVRSRTAGPRARWSSPCPRPDALRRFLLLAVPLEPGEEREGGALAGAAATGASRGSAGACEPIRLLGGQGVLAVVLAVVVPVLRPGRAALGQRPRRRRRAHAPPAAAAPTPSPRRPRAVRALAVGREPRPCARPPAPRRPSRPSSPPPPPRGPR